MLMVAPPARPMKQMHAKSWWKLSAKPAFRVATKSVTDESRMTGRRPKATQSGSQMKKPTPMSSVGHEAKVSTVNGAMS